MSERSTASCSASSRRPNGISWSRLVLRPAVVPTRDAPYDIEKMPTGSTTLWLLIVELGRPQLFILTLVAQSVFRVALEVSWRNTS